MGDTTSYTYSPAGQTLTTTDPERRGHHQLLLLPKQQRPVRRGGARPAGARGDDLYSTTTPATSADPSGEVTTYTYYPGDQADTTTTPAGTTTDTYDATGDLTSIRLHDHGQRLRHADQRRLHLQPRRHPGRP